MSPLQRVLAIGVVPILALLTLHFFSPTTTSNLQDIVRLYARGTFIERLLPSTPTPRSSIPLIITCITHWSHLDKIASVAYELATLGYPITFLTGRVFEKQISSIHPNIKFSPFLGNDDKISEKDMQTMLSLPPEEHELFFSKKVLVDFMPDYHETLQQQAQSFRREHGQTKPLIFLHDHVLVGQHATALGAPGIRPDASIAISHTPITLDSNDTFPLRMGKVPHTGADAKAVHWAAYKEYYEQPFMKGLNEYFWAKLRQMGTHREPFPPIFHGMNSLPDYLLTQGIPEFEFPRSDVRRDIRYFGAFKKVQKFEDGGQGLPEWWDDVARAKKEGKRIISVSQGTVEVDPQQLTLPTIEALKDRDDVLLIATFVAMEPSDIPNLEVPRNTRVAKFVPYDLLLPYVDILITNGGYGAIQHALRLGIPIIVAGETEDKAANGALVQWSGVGINLAVRRPGVAKIREAFSNITANRSYADKAKKLSKEYNNYDVGQVFDQTIQGIVQNWRNRTSTKS